MIVPPIDIPVAVLTIAKPLVQEFENCVLHEYPDLRGLPTIGWGLRINHGQYPNGITQAQADLFLNQKLQGFTAGVLKLITHIENATINEIAALVSFAYNEGLEAEKTSTLLRLYNAGDKTGASAQFTRWDYAGCEEVDGLHRRRECEQYVFDGHSIADLNAVKWFEKVA